MQVWLIIKIVEGCCCYDFLPNFFLDLQCSLEESATDIEYFAKYCLSIESVYKQK